MMHKIELMLFNCCEACEELEGYSFHCPCCDHDNRIYTQSPDEDIVADGFIRCENCNEKFFFIGGCEDLFFNGDKQWTCKNSKW